MAPNETTLAQVVFIHKQLLTAILPLRGGRGRGIAKKIQKKATLLVAQYRKTKV